MKCYRGGGGGGGEGREEERAKCQFRSLFLDSNFVSKHLSVGVCTKELMVCNQTIKKPAAVSIIRRSPVSHVDTNDDERNDYEKNNDNNEDDLRILRIGRNNIRGNGISKFRSDERIE